MTTHVALTARAFGAKRAWYTGHKDASLENSIANVVKNFGGDFSIGYVGEGVKFVKERKDKGWLVIHLSVYGLKLKDEIKKIKEDERNILVIVGGEKVDWDFYKLSNFNISITSQPHSEVSSLALFLDYYFEGAELDFEFGGATKIVPQAMGKKILKK